MPFGDLVKAEIYEFPASKNDERYARLGGILTPWLEGTLADKITIRSEKFELIDEIAFLTGGYEQSFLKEEKTARGKEFALTLDFEFMPELAEQIISRVARRRFVEACFQNENLRSFWFGGLFLGCGHMQDPMKGYRLEFALKNQEAADLVFEVLKEHFPGVKKAIRNGAVIIYTKDSETVEVMLTCLKAVRTCFEVMNVKIYKGIRNQANRALNCDSANINRMLRATNLQLAAVAKLEASGELFDLPEKMQKVADQRKLNPQASIKELAGILGFSVGSVGYSLRRLTELGKA